MTDLVNISDFTYGKGAPLASGTVSYPYLYGLSDFWQYIFEDTEKVNLLLEATSTQAADIYSSFLQLCAGISIQDIATSASSQIKLQILQENQNVSSQQPILSGTWSNGFTTLTLVNNLGFAVGDIITVTSVSDITVYDIGGGINIDVINEGGVTSIVPGRAWNGTFAITAVGINNTITYYQANDPGAYTQNGIVSISSIGAETYQLPDKIASTRFIVNKPLIPDITLEEGVDYEIDEANQRISFAKDIATYGFPTRNVNGVTEYSLWFVDVRFDQDLIYQNYPLLLGRHDSVVTTEDYRTFLYGLYYIYTSGPSLTTLEKGLNLVLGVPLANDNELVLEIRNYINTGQTVVITDQNSYVLPVGLISQVAPGDTLNVGDEMAKWVEIIDSTSFYNSNGTEAWWINYPIEIPASILPFTPNNASRATLGDPGFYTDWIMSNYLKRNTFLVKINASVDEFSALSKFETIPNIVNSLKPNHTQAIYYYLSSIAPRAVFTRGYANTVVPGLMFGLVGNHVFSSVGSVRYGYQPSQNSFTSTVGHMSPSNRHQVGSVSVAGSLGVITMGAALRSVSSTSTVANPTVNIATYASYITLNAGTSAGTFTTSTLTGSNLSVGLAGNSSVSSLGIIN